ncbi:BlaI/MecI/CopY family transcriptional regulator [bacterium]|nr:BlaI/MecI/CopY family transcriptional regulator [bacterium]
MQKKQPSNLELQVLTVLWDEGPSSAREVMDKMPDGKKRAYTTVLSTLQVLEKKELVTHESQGNTHIYSPLVERDRVMQPIVRGMVDHIFGGKPSKAVQCFLEQTEVDDEELKEIRKLLRSMEKQGKMD